MTKRFKIILTSFLLLGSLYFLFMGLSEAKGFLIPLVTAIILTMVMNPVAQKLKSWGIKWGLAVLLSDLVIVFFISSMILLLAAQANQVAENWPEIEDRLKPKIEEVQEYLNEKLNIRLAEGIQQGQGQFTGQSQQDTPGPGEEDKRGEKTGNRQDFPHGEQAGPEANPANGTQPGDNPPGTSGGKQEQALKQTDRQGGMSSLLNLNNLRSRLTGLITDIFSFLGDLLLILVYVFFFTFYQKKFEQAIIGLIPDEKKENGKRVLKQSARVAQQYLFGRLILIAILAGLYMAGYSLIGLKYAIFIAIIAAVFSLIPYVGNIMGLLLAMAMSFMAGGGGAGQLIGIFLVFSVTQFVESYILEPYIVGDKVDLNPVMVIVGVVLGGIVWGIMGMILSIPILGILKVIFDNTETLKPLGYALDERDIAGGNSGHKIKEWTLNQLKKFRK